MWWFIPIFIIFSFIFSSSETALFSLPLYRRKDNLLIEKLMKHPRRIIVTVMIANVLSNVAISSVSGGLMQGYINILLATILVTLFILIFGEYIPKRVAIAKQKTISRIFSPVVLIAQYIFYPFILIFKPLNKLKRYKDIITIGDLREVIHRGKRDGIISEQEHLIMYRLSQLNEMQVKDIMTPRIDVFFVKENETVNDVLRRLKAWHKRIPVYRENRDKITGILETKNLFMGEGLVKDYLSPSIFVSENLPIIQLIKIFKNTSNKMVVVINEYGGTSGVVDMEDVKNELIGEAYINTINKVEKNVWIVPGSMDIDEMNSVIKIPESNDYRTVSGFIYTILERIPKEGEEFSFRNYEFTILDIKDNHIRRVKIKKRK